MMHCHLHVPSKRRRTPMPQLPKSACHISSAQTFPMDHLLLPLTAGAGLALAALTILYLSISRCCKVKQLTHRKIPRGNGRTDPLKVVSCFRALLGGGYSSVGTHFLTPVEMSARPVWLWLRVRTPSVRCSKGSYPPVPTPGRSSHLHR